MPYTLPDESEAVCGLTDMNQERRATFRVSVRPKSGIAVSLYVNDRRWTAMPGNISAEGIFIRLADADTATLNVGDKVDVEIARNDKKLLLRGIVRSYRSAGYGIFFPPKDDNGYVNPLNEIAKLSMNLQRSLLARRNT